MNGSALYLEETGFLTYKEWGLLTRLHQDTLTSEIMDGLIWLYAKDVDIWNWLHTPCEQLAGLEPILCLDLGWYEKVLDVVEDLIASDYAVSPT